MGLYKNINISNNYLNELYEQVKLIEAELMVGEVSEMRDKISGKTKSSKDTFIGGMQEIKLGQRLEYWPVSKVREAEDFPDRYEWWEDELGFYVYNLTTQCK